MKITYFINQYPQVSHTFIRREIIALEQQGFEIQRIALRGWDADIADETDKIERSKTQYLLKDGVKSLVPFFVKRLVKQPASIIRAIVSAVKLSKMSERSLPYHLVYLLEACKLASFMEQFDSRHVHAHFGTNSTEVVMLANLLINTPYSFTVHGPEEFDKPLSLHLNEKIANSKFVSAITSYCRSQLFRWADYEDWSKIRIVHCGLDETFLQGQVTDPSISSTRQFLCIGRLCEQKGQLLLLEAFKDLVAVDPNVKLILAGDGDMRPQVESYISQFGLHEHVDITGWISSGEVKRLLTDSDAMILPSFAEGLPVAIMEAMAIGTPVLTTYIAGIPELLTTNENAILFPAGDVSATTKAMKDFIELDEAALSILIHNAYSSVATRHNINVEAAKLACHIRQG
ncbi:MULTISPECIES: glycosyltransferase family 4 protein [unclassified Shewanella]|uniref:glycosyltransferase family 4 protein n=1 Tax=unclassified Shewanella TaxID=196818 RepID=UPI0035502D0E